MKYIPEYEYATDRILNQPPAPYGWRPHPDYAEMIADRERRLMLMQRYWRYCDYVRRQDN